MNKKEIGNQGEALAAEYLQAQGLRILTRNYYFRGGEIDIIAKDDDMIVFVEVRSRNEAETYFGLPEETLDQKKWQRIKKGAEKYLWENNLHTVYCRFDMIAIVWKNTPEIKWYRDILA